MPVEVFVKGIPQKEADRSRHRFVQERPEMAFVTGKMREIGGRLDSQDRPSSFLVNSQGVLDAVRRL